RLDPPYGMDIDDDGSVYICDHYNHRVVKWISDANYGATVAGGNGPGDSINQLFFPTDVVIDKETNSLIICDSDNSRVVKWFLQSSKNPEIIVSEIICDGLALDNNGDLYFTDPMNHTVIQWKQEAKNGIVVAGGNGEGNDFNQLFAPGTLWVDKDYSVYVSDTRNHRVMKWLKGAKEGIVVAGGHGKGNELNQLNLPRGLIVDHLSNVYVGDTGTYRVMRWPNGSREGSIIVGPHSCVENSNNFCTIHDICFDRQGNLYIADRFTHIVQKFYIDDLNWSYTKMIYE
ncbi:unnamed protein product, partial [Adineta ricciae]